MKRLSGITLVIAAACVLGGCYYDPGYYVRGDGYHGDVGYGTSYGSGYYGYPSDYGYGSYYGYGPSYYGSNYYGPNYYGPNIGLGIYYDDDRGHHGGRGHHDGGGHQDHDRGHGNQQRPSPPVRSRHR